MKVGIVYFRPVLARCGGPGTYLYNLLESYKEYYKEDDELCLITKKDFKYKKVITKVCNIILKIVTFVLKNIFLKDGLIKRFLLLIWEKIKIISESLEYKEKIGQIVENEFDFFHFHSYDDLFYYNKYTSNNVTPKILTLHSPQKIDEEMLEILKQQFNTNYGFEHIRKDIDNKVKLAFEIADYYIFPCKECYDLYCEMGYISDNNKSVEYLITGTYSIYNNNSIDNIDEVIKSIISSPQIKCMYCGRHNQIKGYDLLVSSFKNLNSNILIVGAGELNENIIPPNSDNWIELGWRNDIEQIMEYMDVIFVIGKSVYFDLIALEAMAHKCIVIASDIGGNRTLGRLSQGVFLFENSNVDELTKTIKMISNFDQEKIDYYKNINFEVYNKFASPKVFSKNYFKCIKRLKENYNA